MKKLIVLLMVLVTNIVLASPSNTGGFSEPNLTVRPPPCCDV